MLEALRSIVQDVNSAPSFRAAISKWHCRIFREKQRYYLEDLPFRLD